MKPWFLRQLVSDGKTSAMYFDPDIAVYAPLDELCALAEKHSIVLTHTPPCRFRTTAACLTRR